MNNEELMAYAIKGMRADIAERAASVKMAMINMKDQLDKGVPSAATAHRFRPAIDNLMQALVAFSESIDKAERFGKEPADAGRN